MVILKNKQYKSFKKGDFDFDKNDVLDNLYALFAYGDGLEHYEPCVKSVLRIKHSKNAIRIKCTNGKSIYLKVEIE